MTFKLHWIAKSQNTKKKGTRKNPWGLEKK